MEDRYTRLERACLQGEHSKVIYPNCFLLVNPDRDNDIDILNDWVFNNCKVLSRITVAEFTSLSELREYVKQNGFNPVYNHMAQDGEYDGIVVGQSKDCLIYDDLSWDWTNETWY